MFNSRITKKLCVDFLIVLLTFALISGGMFFVMFRNHTIESNEKEMKEYALTLAETISSTSGESLSSNGHGKNGKGGGNNWSSYGAYLRFIGQVSSANVTVIDHDYNNISVGNGYGAGNNDAHVNYEENGQISEETKIIAKSALDGQTVTEKSNDEKGQLLLTVGVPIIDGNEKINGAVLITSPAVGVSSATFKALKTLLISLLIALFVAITLAIIMARRFTKPLNKMSIVAHNLIDGDYKSRSNITQNDEIGDLSKSIDELANTLNLAREESMKLDKLRKDFVSNISHELRTPVTVIRGSLEALCDGVVTEETQVKNYNREMLAEAKFLERLIGDLLELTRLQNVDFPIEKTKINIYDVLEDAVRVANRIGMAKHAHSSLSSSSKALWVMGDYSRLRQMFTIILDNAVKFSDAYGEIDVELEENSITIRDRGCGIKEEDLPYIFDRFHKTYGENNKNGTGLGLAIAKELAVRHNMDLIAYNHKDGGAVFKFTFESVTER